MKSICILIFFLLTTNLLFSQTITKPDTGKHVAKLDTINPNKGNEKQQLKNIKEKRITLHSDSISHDSIGNQPKASSKIDTTVQNKYGDLLNDDTAFNRKYSVWIPSVEVIGDNIALSLVDSRILKLQFSKVNIVTWKRTLSAGWPWNSGWEWDQDRFGNNFLSHPIMGNFYFNDARSNGYNFWASMPFAFAGSYMWKIFGENGTPEREDIVNTTFDGIVLGEILYRISSNILDDRTRGRERVFREILAGIIDPMRGINRLLQGKTFRHTNKEIYQKEPLNITLYGGIRNINGQSHSFLSGKTSEIFNLQVDYGNPFEVLPKKAFDLFRLRVDMNFGVGRKFVDNVTGYGILFGHNTQVDKVALLMGGFMYYDYWDNTTFELGTVSLGYGVFSKLPIGKTSNLYTSVHLGVVPLAGGSTGPVPDTSQYRDYSYGYGWEGKFEISLVLGKVATIGINYYYFMIHNFNNTGRNEYTPELLQIGTLGTNYTNIFKPRITFQVYKSFSIGLEQYMYYQVHNQEGYSSFTSFRTEQKIFILIYLEDPQRRGHYN